VSSLARRSCCGCCSVARGDSTHFFSALTAQHGRVRRTTKSKLTGFRPIHVTFRPTGIGQDAARALHAFDAFGVPRTLALALALHAAAPVQVSPGAEAGAHDCEFGWEQVDTLPCGQPQVQVSSRRISRCRSGIYRDSVSAAQTRVTRARIHRQSETTNPMTRAGYRSESFRS
jgi:hypothetical protein